MADSTKVWAATIPADGAAVFAAPIGTALPTDASTDLDPAFVDLGWVSEEGVSNGISRETTKHYAWGGDVVKTTQDRYTETVKFALLESSPEVLQVVYGTANVVADDTAGTIEVHHSSHKLAHQSFVIEFVDGESVGRIVIEDGLVTEMDDVKYSHKELLMYGLTVDVYRPKDGTAAVKQYFSLGAGTATDPIPGDVQVGTQQATTVSRTASGTKTSADKAAE
jgi:hypothetical protein